MLFDIKLPHLLKGGIEGHVRMLGEELWKRGHQVVICAVGHPPEHRDEDGIKSYSLQGFFQKIPFLYKDPAQKKPPPTQDWLISRELRRILKEEKPDVVHTHGLILYSILPLKKNFRIPLVATLHNYGLICPKTDLLKRDNTLCDKPLTSRCISCCNAFHGPVKSLAAYVATKVNRKNLKNVDKFIAVSSYTKATYFPHLGVEESDIIVIPNFYILDTHEAVKTYECLPEDFILYVGNLNPSKGVDVLIEAYLRLSTEAKLVIIGARHPDYHYRSTEKIVIVENASRNLVMEAYQNCLFSLFPSIRPDPFPVVTLEAMSHKKAVIASRSGGVAEVVVDRETGILVPPGDVEALSQAINDLLENSNIAYRMGQNGYERWQQNFTPEVAVPKFEKVYNSVV